MVVTLLLIWIETIDNKPGPLLQIIDSVLTLTTHEVNINIGVAAYISDDIVTVLNQFMVKSITHAKDNKKMPHHEVLIVELIDTDAALSESGRHLLILERNSSEVNSQVLSPAWTSSYWQFYQLVDDYKLMIDYRLKLNPLLLVVENMMFHL